MKPPHIALESIRRIGPPCYTTTASEEWTDRNRHVNIRYYAAIFDDAGDAFYPHAGLGEADHERRGSGTMDLEHHTHFLREVRAGDQVSVYLRILGVSGKRWHYMMFLVNETSAQLAATFECVNTFVDLGIRRSAPWPPEIASALKTLLARHDSLDWVAPSCGSMHA